MLGWLNAWMHWLTKYTNKECHAHSDMHSIKPNIHDTIWLHMINKLQRVRYKIIQSYVAYNALYRIELHVLSIPYNATKSYVTKSQRV